MPCSFYEHKFDEMLADYLCERLEDKRLHDFIEHLKVCSECMSCALIDVEIHDALLWRVKKSKKSNFIKKLSDVVLRYSPIIPELADFLDMTHDECETFLRRYLTEPQWQKTALPGHGIIETGMVTSSGYSVSLTILEPYGEVCTHTHPGTERYFVLQGVMTEEIGTIFRGGKVREHPAGEPHSYRTATQIPLILVILTEGFSLYEQLRPKLCS